LKNMELLKAPVFWHSSCDIFLNRLFSRITAADSRRLQSAEVLTTQQVGSVQGC
jgi:hypothetical protein